MEKSSIIVAFHIGRGGRFYNGGYKSFVGEKKIGDFTDNLFTSRENEHKLYNIAKKRGLKNVLAKLDECRDTDDFSFFEKRGFDIGGVIYHDGNGNPVGLTEEDVACGVGCINIDHDYDTTYTCCIEDCSDDEIQLIRDYKYYKSVDLENYLEEIE